MKLNDKNSIWFGALIGVAIFGIFWWKRNTQSITTINPAIIKWTE